VSGYQEPFFTRGPSPLARLTFFSLAAIAIMIADHRFQALSWVRLGVSVVLNPIEQGLAMPGMTARRIGSYFTDQTRLITENRELQNQVLELTALGQQAKLIQAERSHIDALAVPLAATKRLERPGIIAEIIRDARNPYARKIILNQGTTHGVTAGVAVIDGLLSSEVTLSTEKDQSVPVMVVRNGLRAVAVGNGREGTIDVPFMPLGADIQVGDSLVTSGIDGTYPAGLSVATIVQVEKNPAFPFAKVVAQPATAPDHHRFVKVLLRATRASTRAVEGAAEGAADYPVTDVTSTERKTAPASITTPAKREARRPNQ